MELKIELENGIGNIGKWNWKHWKEELLEKGIGNIGKWNRWNYQKIEMWNWLHWKME